MEKNDAFLEKIRKEILQTQEFRMRIDILKITFVIALLGFGSVKVSEISSLYNTLYLAPLVALLFDIMSLGHTFTIRRNGKFLRQYSQSDLERQYEEFVAQNRDKFFKFGSFIFNLLAFPAVILLIKAVTGKYPVTVGWIVLIILLIFHVTVFIIGSRKIKGIDLKVP